VQPTIEVVYQNSPNRPNGIFGATPYLAKLKTAEAKEEFAVVRSGNDLACFPVHSRSTGRGQRNRLLE
jgi:hypothetical protein